MMCGLWHAIALWHLGYPDQALAQIDRDVASKQGTPHSGDLGAAYIVAAWVRLLRRENADALACARTAIDYNTERGFAFHVAISDVVLGAAMAASGDPDGIEQMRRGTEACSATGAGIFQPWYFVEQAQGHARLDAPQAGSMPWPRPRLAPAVAARGGRTRTFTGCGAN